MCGIAIIHGNGKIEDLRIMMEMLEHRGPDDKGIHQDDGCLMGQQRLSIIDVSGGKQPIYNENQKMCIVYNGEVYNFLNLKDRLKNHTFKTKTDTEVILHLYEEYGKDCVKFLDGMFTFAIWDVEELFVARDPLGIKPLYYGERDGTKFFASEFKALLYFLLDEIKEFPPGHTYSSKTGFSQYYVVPDPEKQNGGENLMEDVRNLLTQAVVKRLVSDVPVGVFLSGGLDSSIVTTVAAKHIKGLHTFSVGMEGAPDLKFAREVANIINSIHHELIYTEEEMISSLDEIIYYLESFDAALVRSSFPCYFVSKLAKENGVKVILTGEGADEVFAGYEYLKGYNEPAILQKELHFITSALHNTNLQRVDRMTMANSVEGRVPFLDVAFIQFALSLAPELKITTDEKMEKSLLREAFQGWLPDNVLWRKKEKFSKGAGSSHIISEKAEKEISNAEFEEERLLNNGLKLRSKEELYYYRIFKEHFPAESAVNLIGRSRSI